MKSSINISYQLLIGQLILYSISPYKQTSSNTQDDHYHNPLSFYFTQQYHSHNATFSNVPRDVIAQFHKKTGKISKGKGGKGSKSGMGDNNVEDNACGFKPLRCLDIFAGTIIHYYTFKLLFFLLQK